MQFSKLRQTLIIRLPQIRLPQGGLLLMALAFVMISVQSAAAQSRGFIKENDMVDGARSGSVGIMERGYIEGLSPNLRSRDGEPVIVIGAEAGHANVVQYLIYRKARLDERGSSGHTALTAAAARGHVEIMKLLLEGGADIDKTGVRKEVPIIIAAREGHYEAVKLLIEKDAYLEDTDLTGRTALDWARESRNRDLIQLLEGAQ